MSAATRELVHLIDLSLGSQPSGVINFNYLHTLMHAIVRRLGTMETAQSTYVVGGGREITAAIDGDGEETGTVGESLETAAGDGAGRDGVAGVPDSTSEGRRVEGEGDGAGGAAQAKKEPSPTSTPPPPPPTSDMAESKPLSSGRASRTGMTGSADLIHQPKSFVTAANDLGAMERKLQELESRLNAMDTLPELLERKSSDMGATPIKDRWNFTNLSKRLSAAEDGLEQVS